MAAMAGAAAVANMAALAVVAAPVTRVVVTNACGLWG